LTNASEIKITAGVQMRESTLCMHIGMFLNGVHAAFTHRKREKLHTGYNKDDKKKKEKKRSK